MSGRSKSNKKAKAAKSGASLKSTTSEPVVASGAVDGDDDFVDEGAEIPEGDEIGTVEVTNSNEIKAYASAREIQKKKAIVDAFRAHGMDNF